MNITRIEDIETLDCSTIATIGMFDGVHLGHQHILQMLQSKAAAEHLTPVVITFDCHPRLALGLTDGGFRLLTLDDERLATLQSFGVQHIVVVPFNREVADLSACEFFRRYLVEKLHCKALLLGYDNMFGCKRHNDFDQLPDLAQSLGVRLYNDSAVLVDGAPVSSTRIRKVLCEGDVATTSRLLGYAYHVESIVVKGKQLGRKMGVPTANLVFGETLKALPKEGVYAVRVMLPDADTRIYGGMANLGKQPTFGGEVPTFEVNIFDFDRDIYGQRLYVEFVEHVRDVRRFDSMESLICQLQQDRTAIRKILKCN